MLTLARLKQFLVYDPVSGEFTRIKYRGKNSGAPNPYLNGYIYYGIDRKRYLAHRLAWFYVSGVWPENLIDHTNGNKTDNRIVNLRECNKSENGANSRLGGRTSSGVKGVHRHGSGWRSKIQVHGKNIYLGTFRTIEEGQRAYIAAAEKHFGEFARVA